MRHNNKRSVESFVVANVAQTTLPADNTALTDFSDGSVNLNENQLGVFQAAPYSPGFLTAITTTDTVFTAPAIQFYQGTAASANPGNATATYPLVVRPYIASDVVEGNNLVSITKQVAVDPTPSIWVIGQPDTDAGEIVAQDNTEYTLGIAYRGAIMDEMYSPEATNKYSPSFPTPDYTALATAEPRDHLIQNLLYELNRNSRALAFNRPRFRGDEFVYGLAISSAGGAGVVIDTIVGGTTIQVVNTNVGVRSVTVNAAQAAAINAAATAAGFNAAVATVLTIDLATAGTITGGVADGIMLVSLDRPLAFVDFVPQTKIRLDVGLASGFNNVATYHQEVVQATEGQGQPRQLDLWWKATQGQRLHELRHYEDPVINYPSPIDMALTYTQYNVRHNTLNNVDTFNTVVSPKLEVILVPSANTTLQTNLEAVLNPWAQSANNPGVVTI